MFPCCFVVVVFVVVYTVKMYIHDWAGVIFVVTKGIKRKKEENMYINVYKYINGKMNGIPSIYICIIYKECVCFSQP